MDHSSPQNPDKPAKSAVALREEEVLKFWQDNKIFAKTLAKESPKGDFVFYDGPPFATGLPHYGHILAGTIKDAIPRYKTMQGYHVPRRWGWDTHGLPIENLIEKELNLKSKKDIEVYGIEKFNEAARAAVLRYDSEWKKIIPRTGRFVDMDNAYLTLNPTYTESIWWSFKALHQKGLVYQGFKVMNLCPHCGTTLSNFEVGLGYKDITDISVYVKFELVDEPGTFLLAWTTTPWTLPGNVALAVNPKIEYVQIEIKGQKYILAKERLAVIKEEYSSADSVVIKKLLGKKYKPVFPYYENTELSNKENLYTIVGADFVTTTDGTGIVHIAPAFGEDDYNLSLKEKLPFIQHVATDGTFKKEVTDFVGQSVKPKGDPQKADIEVIKYLAGKGTLFAKEKIIHPYPHCWRCDTPLLNYASSSWFVEVTKIKDQLVAENKKVLWVPEDVGVGRFGKWLEGARDWAISRSRFWGAPLPVWKCSECEKIEIVGSVEELKKLSGGVEPHNAKGELDLHRPYIDKVSWKCSCGGEFKRVPEVFDTWYESGSMPYAQIHYPFENKELIDGKKFFPADFIAEGQDQTRGWFYSLLVLSSALFGVSPFKSVVVNGIILAENGQKMSKSLNNYPDPEIILNKYGADAMRHYLLSSPVVHAEDIMFSEKFVDDVLKKLIMRLENVVSFYELYNDDVSSDEKSTHVLDAWIIARLSQLKGEVTTAMEAYELDRATRPFELFIDDLSTWYLRRSRDRFKREDVEDKKAALATTRFVLLELSKLSAPFMPFIAETIYQKVKGKDGQESVHLEPWPEVHPVDGNILAEMTHIRTVVSLALEARSKAGIKVRQPLSRLTVKNFTGPKELLELIKDEVNVKEVIIDSKISSEVELDIALTPELEQEGTARDLIRALQDVRKKSKFSPHDVVAMSVKTDDAGKKIIEAFKADIMSTAKISMIAYEENSGEAIVVGSLSFKVLLAAHSQ